MRGQRISFNRFGFLSPRFVKPIIEIVEDEANERQQDDALNGLAYHIIKTSDPASYKIGFCRHGEYVTADLDPKDSVYRFITEDPDLLTSNQSQNDGITITYTEDELLLLFLEFGIKKLGGTIARRSYEEIDLAKCDEALRREVEQEVLRKLSICATYNEIAEACAILNRFPQLMLSGYSTTITDCNEIREREATIFQYALLTGNWYFWEMILKCIPDDGREQYEADLYGQFCNVIEIEEEGVQQARINYILDNLMYWGLWVFEVQEMENAHDDVLDEVGPDFPGYCLLLQRDHNQNIIDYQIGYFRPNECWVPATAGSPLFFELQGLQKNSWNKNGDGPYHCRNKKILRSVRAELEEHGCETKIMEDKIFNEDLSTLIASLHGYINDHNDQNLSDVFKSMIWCIVLGRRELELSAMGLSFLMKPIGKDPQELQENDFRRLPVPHLLRDFDGFSVFPVSDGLGANFAFDGPARGEASERTVQGGLPGAAIKRLELLMAIQNRKLEELYQRFVAHAEEKSRCTPFCSML